MYQRRGSMLVSAEVVVEPQAGVFGLGLSPGFKRHRMHGDDGRDREHQVARHLPNGIDHFLSFHGWSVALFSGWRLLSGIESRRLTHIAWEALLTPRLFRGALRLIAANCEEAHTFSRNKQLSGCDFEMISKLIFVSS